MCQGKEEGVERKGGRGERVEEGEGEGEGKGEGEGRERRWGKGVLFQILKLLVFIFHLKDYFRCKMEKENFIE